MSPKQKAWGKFWRTWCTFRSTWWRKFLYLAKNYLNIIVRPSNQLAIIATCKYLIITYNLLMLRNMKSIDNAKCSITITCISSTVKYFLFPGTLFLLGHRVTKNKVLTNIFWGFYEDNSKRNWNYENKVKLKSERQCKYMYKCFCFYSYSLCWYQDQ